MSRTSTRSPPYRSLRRSNRRLSRVAPQEAPWRTVSSNLVAVDSHSDINFICHAPLRVTFSGHRTRARASPPIARLAVLDSRDWASDLRPQNDSGAPRPTTHVCGAGSKSARARCAGVRCEAHRAQPNTQDYQPNSRAPPASARWRPSLTSRCSVCRCRTPDDGMAAVGIHAFRVVLTTVLRTLKMRSPPNLSGEYSS